MRCGRIKKADLIIREEHRMFGERWPPSKRGAGEPINPSQRRSFVSHREQVPLAFRVRHRGRWTRQGLAKTTEKRTQRLKGLCLTGEAFQLRNLLGSPRTRDATHEVREVLTPFAGIPEQV